MLEVCVPKPHKDNNTNFYVKIIMSIESPHKTWKPSVYVCVFLFNL